MRAALFHPGGHSRAVSLGLLALRVAFGLMLALGHGWGKLVGFGAGAATFPDPLHIGPRWSMACTIGTEFFGSLLVAIGLATRWAALSVAFTMGVAGFLVQAGAPWGKRELACAYLVPFFVLVLTGAGRFSVDARLGGRRKGSRQD